MSRLAAKKLHGKKARQAITDRLDKFVPQAVKDYLK